MNTKAPWNSVPSKKHFQRVEKSTSRAIGRIGVAAAIASLPLLLQQLTLRRTLPRNVPQYIRGDCFLFKGGSAQVKPDVP